MSTEKLYTPRELFEKHLTEEQSKQAIANSHPNLIDFKDYADIVEAIESSFCWARTPEGHIYWMNICDNHKESEV